MINTNKTLLAAMIAASLVGCGGSGSSDPQLPDSVPTENVAPQHPGDIAIALSEKGISDDSRYYYYLTGQVDGSKAGNNGANGALDANGDPLQIKNVRITLDGETIEHDGGDGMPNLIIDDGAFELASSHFRVMVQPRVYMDELVNETTKTLEITYDVSDGELAAERVMTVVIQGADVPPEFHGNVEHTITKDAANAPQSFDLLEGATDGDGDDLSAVDLSPADDNLFKDADVHSVDGGNLILDLSSVKDSIPFGVSTPLVYNYNVFDGLRKVPRQVVINVFGVEDIPGAPDVTEYVLNKTIQSTDALTRIDLLEGVSDAEGDAITAFDGDFAAEQAYKYGFSFEGNELVVDPHAFYTLAVGEQQTVSMTYRLKDSNDIETDGFRTVNVTVVGAESNLFVETFDNYNFEKPLALPIHCPWGCGAAPYQTEGDAANGNGSMLFEGSTLLRLPNDNLPDMKADTKYYLAYNLKTGGAAPMTALSTIAGNLPDIGYKFWFSPRPAYNNAGEWDEAILYLDTGEFGNYQLHAMINTYGAENISMFLFNGSGNDDIPPLAMDDYRMVEFGHIDSAIHDIVADDAGTFEDLTAAVAVDGGSATISADAAANGTTGGLAVDTTGAAGPVVVSLPVSMGAVKPGARFAVSMSVTYTNFSDNYGNDVSTPVGVALATASGDTISTVAQTYGGYTMAPTVLLNEATQASSAGIDWENETVTLELSFTEANAQYNIDNVRVIEIP
ncbi:hypothetical protein IC617_02445 [Neiella sp. HB171785]|uniref:Uncharacterized protein n=1 Tax=Neiella litorisoli TaxID=2771431 RepID=A0A8J6UL44_9GAMM|nr:hypothetical protein [Neiella litorisoli]MBD1388275.1 hypothetical protein [Neiella litorisoli]